MRLAAVINPRSLWAGLVVACLGGSGAWGEATTSPDLPLPEQCLSGFTPQDTANRAAPVLSDGAPSRPLPPAIGQWLTAQHWQAGYDLWQRARRCHSGFGSTDQAACSGPPSLEQGICQGPQDGLAFLAMHRHLLHSLRAAWPTYRDEWASWRRFPERSDYPLDPQSAFAPWPRAVVRAAQAVDNLRNMPRAQLLARWPSEGAFGQWLQCGSNAGGMAVDSLYGALLTQAGLDRSPHELDNRLFWRSHAWIDRAWDAYRKKLGKTPDDPQLQALLIQQCQQHSAWALRAAQLKLRPAPRPSVQEALFVQGELNPKQTGAWVSVFGEVTAVISGPPGQWLVTLDLHLLAAKPLWFTSPAALEGIQPGDRLRVAGYLQPAAQLDPSGRLTARIQAAHLLQATAILSSH